MSEKEKQKLIKELTLEMNRFKERGQDTLEHEVAIEYLKKGWTDEDLDNFELLDACINDLETILSDYGVR